MKSEFFSYRQNILTDHTLVNSFLEKTNLKITPRQKEVLLLRTAAYSSEEICKMLNISKSTYSIFFGGNICSTDIYDHRVLPSIIGIIGFYERIHKIRIKPLVLIMSILTKSDVDNKGILQGEFELSPTALEQFTPIQQITLLSRARGFTDKEINLQQNIMTKSSVKINKRVNGILKQAENLIGISLKNSEIAIIALWHDGHLNLKK